MLKLDDEHFYKKETRNTINDLILKFIPKNRQYIYEQEAKIILDQYIRQESGNIHHNTNPKVMGGAIFYLTPKISSKLGDIKIFQQKIADEVKIARTTLSRYLIKFSNLYERTFKIKHKKILDICDWIYMKFPDKINNLQELRDLIINKFDMSKKSEEYERFLNVYIRDLIMIVLKLKEINDREIKERFEIYPFTQDLIKKRIDINGRSLDALAEIILKMLDHFKETFPKSFRLERKGFQDISKNEQVQIRRFKNKFRLVMDSFTFLVKGKLVNIQFNGKCMNPNCPTHADFRLLPILEIHHKKKLNKEEYVNIIEVLQTNYTIGKKRLESQEGGVEIFCRDCHKLKTFIFFGIFSRFLQHDLLFVDEQGEQRSAEEIIELIVQTVEEHLSSEIRRRRAKKIEGYKTHAKKIERYKIVNKKMLIKWVKRRAVMEQIWGKNYTCIGCGKVSINDNLHSFEFHHANALLFDENNPKTYFKKKFEELEVREIIELLIMEECVCLCGNCHRLITVKHFENNVERIIGRKYVKEVKNYHENIRKSILMESTRIVKIKNLLIENGLKIQDTLKKMVNEQKETWKKYIVQIYLVYKSSSIIFTRVEIARILGYNDSWFLEARKPLQKMNLISVKNNYKAFSENSLTEKGINTARTIIKDWKTNHAKEYQRFLNYYNLSD